MIDYGEEKMLNEVAVVIPYYHNELSEYEKISYVQCIRVLGIYPIILVVPDNFCDVDLPKDEGVMIEKVPKEWLQSVSSYNAMMLNIEFYRRFQRYKYILLYQLDAFVFSDKLLEMCQYDYDYIGAPWLRGYLYYLDEQHCIWRVGNGGFSLRKVQGFINLLQKKEQEYFVGNEDLFYAVSNSDSFKVAPVEVALKFSFEQEVKKCFQLNNDELPFGCHAWEKYDLRLLASIINSYGYNVNGDLAENRDYKLEESYQKQRELSNFWENKFSISRFKNELPKLFTKQIKNYVIWGAGYYGRILCKIMQDARLPIKKIIDSNSKFVGKKMGDIDITDDLASTVDKSDVIIIAIKNNAMEVADLLNKKGYIYKKDYILLEDLFCL